MTTILTIPILALYEHRNTVLATWPNDAITVKINFGHVPEVVQPRAIAHSNPQVPGILAILIVTLYDPGNTAKIDV